MPDTQPTRADLREIVTGLDSLEVKVDGARTQAKKSSDRSRNLAAIAIGVGLLGVLVGIRGWMVGSDAQNAINTANEVRATARISSCEQAFDFATSHNDLVRRSQDLLRAVAAGSTRPETQEFVNEQVAAYEANIVLVRDCSPEGIASFADGTGGYLPP